MANGVTIPALDVEQVDEWVLSVQPTVEDVAARLAQIRRLARHLRVAEAHLVTYAREASGLSELEDTPQSLRSSDVLIDE